jgi:hypothetical protein
MAAKIAADGRDQRAEIREQRPESSRDGSSRAESSAEKQNEKTQTRAEKN